MTNERDIRLAEQFLDQGKAESSLRILEPGLKQLECSNDPASFTLLGRLFLGLGDWEKASEWFAKATLLDPKHAAAWQGMADAFASAGQFPPAANAMAHALAHHAAPPASTLLRAATYSRLAGQLERAAALLANHGPFPIPDDEAIRLGNLSECLLEQGRLDALAELETSFHGALDSARLFHTNHVRAALYRPEETGRSLRLRAERWGKCFAPRPTTQARWPDRIKPGTRIRIGFLNTCCHAHNTAQHLLGLLPHIDRKKWHVTLIHAGHKTDEITRQLKKRSDRWLHIDPHSPESITGVRKAKLHVLIDMNEFANGGMLWLLSHQPAPVMLHWYGNAITTGLGYLDGRFTDPHAEPPEVAATGSSEPTLPLTGGYYAYQPFDFHQSASLAAPFEKNGHVTLGVIHHLGKFSTPYLKCLGEILAQCPTARLQIWRSALADAPTRRRFEIRLGAHDLPMDRVSLHHDPSEIATLRCFAGFDLIPDAFPFTGDATNLDALASATPYLTLEGDHLAARRGAAILRHLSITELIAISPEDYIARCVNLVQNPERLRKLRTQIHHDFPRSPLCDGKRLAKEMISAIRTIIQAKLAQLA